MGTVITRGVLVVMGLVLGLGIRAKSRLRHSLDAAYPIPDDMRRADDQPPPEPDSYWLM